MAEGAEAGAEGDSDVVCAGGAVELPSAEGGGDSSPPPNRLTTPMIKATAATPSRAKPAALAGRDGLADSGEVISPRCSWRVREPSDGLSAPRATA